MSRALPTACDYTSNRRLGLVASVVTKAVYPETEAEVEAEAEAPVLETKAEAVDPTEAEAARQYINKSHI